MRIAIVLLLSTACGTTQTYDGSCPANVTEGDACSFAGRCWHLDNFSTCASSWCMCKNGKVACDEIAPHNGDACGDEPIDQCSYEGNPGCMTNPTAEYCSCNEGTWRCTCSCYGGLTSCPIDPCTLYPMNLNMAYCADHGRVCSYPGNSACVCEETSPDVWQFVCR